MPVTIVHAVLHNEWHGAGAWLAAGHQLARAAVEGQKCDGQHLVRYAPPVPLL